LKCSGHRPGAHFYSLPHFQSPSGEGLIFTVDRKKEVKTKRPGAIPAFFHDRNKILTPCPDACLHAAICLLSGKFGLDEVGICFSGVGLIDTLVSETLDNLCLFV